MVRFATGNILDEGFMSDAELYDVIFCRNLLIYFTDAAKRRAVEALDRLLKKGGPEICSSFY